MATVCQLNDSEFDHTCKNVKQEVEFEKGADKFTLNTSKINTDKSISMRLSREKMRVVRRLGILGP